MIMNGFHICPDLPSGKHNAYRSIVKLWQNVYQTEQFTFKVGANCQYFRVSIKEKKQEINITEISPPNCLLLRFKSDCYVVNRALLVNPVTLGTDDLPSK